MSAIEQEITSQPVCWRKAAEASRDALPRPGERALIAGCGTSFYVAQAAAALREAAGGGETDSYPASEAPVTRTYDRVVVISRSGTTTEVERLLQLLPAHTPTTAITAVPSSPIASATAEAVLLDFADERSVVQTRFATSAMALFRAAAGDDLDAAIADAERAIAAPLPRDPTNFDHFVFLGHGWTVGLANEAALKLREAAQAHTEAYPSMEFRHGPISLAGSTTLVWILGTPDPTVADECRATGATVIETTLDPMAELILIQRTAVALARWKGLDPDRPRHLSRSVVLSGTEGES